jgi:hypothetical protein
VVGNQVAGSGSGRQAEPAGFPCLASRVVVVGETAVRPAIRPPVQARAAAGCWRWGGGNGRRIQMFENVLDGLRAIIASDN